MSIYSYITRGKSDQILHQQGILNSEGRLTDTGFRDFVDLLFIGKTPKEARDAILKVAKELNSKD